MSSSGESRLQRQRRRQLLEAARSRYQLLSYQEKGALVDELVELSGYHRKSVLWLLRQQPADHGGPPRADSKFSQELIPAAAAPLPVAP